MAKRYETTAGELVTEVTDIYDALISPHDSPVLGETDEVRRKLAEVTNYMNQMAVLTDFIWDAAQLARVNAGESKTENEDELNATPISINVRRFLRGQIREFRERVKVAAERWNLGPQ